jgi:hypothetical protein
MILVWLAGDWSLYEQRDLSSGTVTHHPVDLPLLAGCPDYSDKSEIGTLLTTPSQIKGGLVHC